MKIGDIVSAIGFESMGWWVIWDAIFFAYFSRLHNCVVEWVIETDFGCNRLWAETKQEIICNVILPT
jgi:hypothetical protein